MKNQGYTYTDHLDADHPSVLDFYTRHYTHSSQEAWLHRIAEGSILLNGDPTLPDVPLRRGDVLTYERAPWVEPDAPLNFTTLYEDDHLIAVDKPSGLPVLPGGHYLQHTLLALVRAQFEGPAPPSPLHRLGRATSGIVLFARTEEAIRQMTATFVNRQITKVYRALLQGTGIPETFVIETPIGPIPYAPTRTVNAATPNGRPSSSEGTRLHENEDARQTLVDIRIITGRPHQIRIHVAAMGHPLVGDPLYVVGGTPPPPVPGQRAPLPGDIGYHLHARRLTFRHPIDGHQVDIASTPPPILKTPEERRKPEIP